MIKLKDFVECVNCDTQIRIYDPNYVNPILVVNGGCVEDLDSYATYVVNEVAVEYGEHFACYLAEESYLVTQVESNISYEYFSEKEFYELLTDNIKVEYCSLNKYLASVTFDQYKESAFEMLNQESKIKVNQLTFEIINKGVK